MSKRPLTLKQKLDKLDGKPPYDTPSNHCYGDSYYAKSLEREYGAPIEELRKKVK